MQRAASYAMAQLDAGGFGLVAVEPYRPILRGLLVTGENPVYLENRPRSRLGSDASPTVLWWPTHKGVGRHLGPYLAALARTPFAPSER